MRLTTRVAMILSASQVLVLGVSALISYRSVRQDLRADFAGRVNGIADLLGHVVRAQLCNTRFDEARSILSEAAEASRLTYISIHQAGATRVHVGSGHASLFGIEDPSELSRRMEASGLYVAFASIEACAPTQARWDVEVGADYSAISGPIEVLERSIRWSMGFELFVAIGLTFFLGRALNRRIEVIREGLMEVASGNFRARIPDSARDEYGAMGKLINSMIASLESMIAQQTRQRQSLATSAKLSALGEMAAGVAHEINNPLAIIAGRMGQLKRILEDPNAIDAKKSLEIVNNTEKTVDRIAKIVRGLKLFSRNAEQDPKEWTPLERIVAETSDLCAERIKHASVKLDIQIHASLEIECRSTQISQVLLNLLGNALDAIKDLPDRWIRLEISESGAERARISIKDSGSGISPEIVEKIMQPFFTTKGVGHGTGLGLSISSGIISDHGGRLWVNQECPNTEFVIELPSRRVALASAA